MKFHLSNKIKLILISIAVNTAFGEFCAPETDWCYTQSTFQAFYFFYEITIDGIDIEQGSVVSDDVLNCPDNDCDIIGAFIGDECVGWTYPYYGGGFTIPAMGNDGSFPDYANPGDVPEFRLFDNSSGIIYSGETDEEIQGWANLEFFVNYLLTNAELSIDTELIPNLFEISDIYPNPFNASTTINYSLPFSSNVNIGAYNLLGQEVFELQNSHQSAGYHTITWEAGDISSGIYLIRLHTEDAVITRKVVLAK